MANAAVAHAHEDHGHPTLEAYVRIAIMLAIITAIEVAIYYIPALEGVLVPALLVLSAIKFVTVVAYFMHLKFDSRLIVFAFTSSMIISIIMFIALWVIMHYDAPTVFNQNMSLLPQKPERP